MYTRPRIIPVLLIDDGDLIKTRQFEKTVYLGDPVNAVKIFNIKNVDEMAILDISVSKNSHDPDYELLEDIASQAFMPLSYGGGIRTVEQAKKLLAIGYEKVIFNTALVENPDVVRETSDLVGKQSVVASIDVKKLKEENMCVVCDGTKKIKIDPVKLAIKAEEYGAGEIFLNSVDHDGMMNGYDTELVKQVAKNVSIPVTACGGAATINDLKKVLTEGNAHAAAAGSMFVFYGRLKAVLITFPSEGEFIGKGIYSK